MAHDLPMGLSLSLFPPELPSYLIAVLDYKIWSVMPAVSIISAIIIFMVRLQDYSVNQFAGNLK